MNEYDGAQPNRAAREARSADRPRAGLGKLVLPTGDEKLFAAADPRGLMAGRGPQSEIFLDDISVSWRHACFQFVDGTPTVRDLDSTNGTFVNGARVVGTHVLADGDHVRLGNVMLAFHLAAPKVARSPAGPEPAPTSGAVTAMTSPPAAAGTPAAPAGREETTGSLVLPGGDEKTLRSGDPGLTAGRVAENDIWLDNPSVSRRHAHFQYVNGAATVRDLGSTNGTFVNGERITGTFILRDGDSIQVGNVVLVFRSVTPAAAPAPAEAAGPVATFQPPAAPPPPAAGPPVEVPWQAPPPAAAGPAAGGITRHTMLSLPAGMAAAELSPLGALDIESAEAFRQLFAELLERGVRRFLVDLQHVNYVDSTGLGTLLQSCRDAQARGGKYWLFNVSPEVRAIFEVTNLHKIINIDSTRAAAFAEAQE